MSKKVDIDTASPANMIDRWKRIASMSDHDLSAQLVKEEHEYSLVCQEYIQWGAMPTEVPNYLLCLREAACLRLRKK
jgi:hypothetical protein